MSTSIRLTPNVPNYSTLNQVTNPQPNTTTQSSANEQLPPIGKTYTGTKGQPDVASVFFKTNTSEIYIADEQIINDLGHSPFEFVNGMCRINNAAKILFQELNQGTLFNENSDSWNALMNFSRGVIQLVPLLGSAVLYVYDFARLHLSTHPKIKSALSNQAGEVVGIAFDGKPVFTVPSSLLYPNVVQTPAERLAQLEYIWLSLITRTMSNKDNFTRGELAEQMHQMLLNRQFARST